MAIDARFTGVLLVRSGDMLDLTILRRAFPLTTDVWCHRRGCGKVACDPSRELGVLRFAGGGGSVPAGTERKERGGWAYNQPVRVRCRTRRLPYLERG